MTTPAATAPSTLDNGAVRPPSTMTPATAVKKSQASITAVAWIPQSDMDLPEWSRAVQKLGAIDRCSPWWIGDCIRYGNTKFGEKYSRVAKLTGYDVQTLMNMVYVASHVEISRRRENLSWSHHDAVTSLPPDIQDYWLDLAIEQKMSVADLRVELRARRAKRDTPPPPNLSDDVDRDGEEAIAMTCPSCGQLIPIESVTATLKELTFAASGAPAKRKKLPSPIHGECEEKGGIAHVS